MAKFTLGRLFEISRYLTTDAGKELKDMLSYLSEFIEIVSRSLKNGITFKDNFDTIEKFVQVNPDTETIVLDPTVKRVREVLIRQAVSDTYFQVNAFGWKYNTQGEVVIKVGFAGSPPSTQVIDLALLIHFG